MWATERRGADSRFVRGRRLPWLLAALYAGQAVAQSSATYVKASNPGVDDQFGGSAVLLGVSLALSGDGETLAVGARMEDSGATGVDGDQQDNSMRNAGAAYVFGRTADGSWEQQAYLKASNTGAADQFGFAVAISDDGDTLAISANLEDSAATGVNGDQHDNSMENSGAVYIFRRDDEGWGQEAYLKASNTGEPEDGDGFGYVLGLSADGNALAVGATGEDGSSTGANGDDSDNSARGAGAVYVFERDGDEWSQQAYLKASNTDATDLFGISLAISDDGETLVISALDEDGSTQGINGRDDNGSRGSGAVYVFTRDGGRWTQQAYLKSSNSGRNDAFSMVALSGDGHTLGVSAFDEDSSDTGVGADQSDDSSEDSGAVYVF
ncbi:MAG: FG-GAP repeat protein, partial [Rhodospirillaceae bacterium]|nr:FG-GAP repeat protein [Rhodospirillaceae bacterium]